jgi:hypothetical protein
MQQNTPHGAVQPALMLWRCWRIHQLSQALEDCRSWEEDAKRHRFGRVHLNFDANHRQWRVLVSTDLMTAEIPF